MPSTTPFRPRNIIDAQAEREYPEAQEGTARPSPGAAVRQLCRSLDDAPHLKRLLEDLLAAQNRATHEFLRERDDRKRMELLANGFAVLAQRSFVAARAARSEHEAQPVAVDPGRESRALLEKIDALESMLSSTPNYAANALRAILDNWARIELGG
jgi:hypothetical protein